MADEKVFAQGNVDVWVGPATGVANYQAPTAAEINALLNVSESLAWEGTTIPAVTESNDNDDRHIKQAGNATTRGFAQYEGSLNLFFPKDQADTSDSHGKAFAFFKKPRFQMVAVVRILQGTEGVITPAVAGQQVSVYRFIADTFIPDLDGEAAAKYTVNLLSQGAVAPNTFVAPAGAITVTNASGSGNVTVGGHAVLRAVLSGFRVNQVVEWTSSDPTKATVSPNGVVTGVAVGTATITASHPSATAASTPVTITVA